MVRNLVLQADRLQAELIVSDIPHSCKAYLRGLAPIVPEEPGEGAAPECPAVPAPGTAPAPDIHSMPPAGRLSHPPAPEAELSALIETARRLTEALGGNTLLAGFRPEGPVPSINPENPPAGMYHYTSFVHYSAETAMLAAQGGQEPALETAARNGVTAAEPIASGQSTPAWRRVRMRADQIDIFLRLHREGMADVPNVPVLTEGDARDLLATDQVDLIELADGTAIGFTDLGIDPAASTASLEEVAILPEWRSHGIGHAVIAELARELADSGIGTLTVLVATANHGALRLYEALGFARPSLYAHWFQMPVRRRESVAPLHTVNDLAAGLAKLGIRPGETLMVHSSMKSLGYVPGGPEALISALDRVLGPEGTLVMAAHSGENTDPANWVAPPVPAEWWPAIREATPAYQPAITPTARIGQVPELFRTLPGVLRSGHPSYSFTARGPQAADIVAVHPMGGALGEPSPSCKLADMGARVLQIGTDYDTCTVMHLGEFQARCRLHIRQGASMLVDGRQQWVEYTDTLGNSDEFYGPGKLLESRGQVHVGTVGEATCRLFRADDAIAAARDWFREHRMHRLDESDRGWLMDLLRQEPEYNLFLIGDVENYGFSEPFQDIMAYRSPRPARERPEAGAPPADTGAPFAEMGAPFAETWAVPAETGEGPAYAEAGNPAIDSIVLRYYTNFIVYSPNDHFVLEPVLSAIDYPTLSMLSAKQPVMDRLRPHLPGYRFSDTFLMRRPTRAGAVEDPASPAGDAADPAAAPEFTPQAGPKVELATLADVPELAAFLYGVPEFRVADQTLADKEETMRRSLTMAGTRYVVVREQGRIVACAGTTAENSQSAMVVSVATDPDCRRRGYATRLVSRLCALHAAEGREFLCLFYSNPEAGAIYRGLGFAEIGTWVMARPPARVPGK